MLVHVVAVDLDKLFEDRGSTTGALDGEASRVVEVTVHRAVVLVVRVLWAKDGGTDGAGEVLDVKLHVCRFVSIRSAYRGGAVPNAVM